MIGSDKQMVNVALLREDVERIKKLKKPVSEFCCETVSERLRIIELAKENTVQDWMYVDADTVTDTDQIVIEPDPVHDDPPVMKTNPDWSKLFARV